MTRGTHSTRRRSGGSALAVLALALSLALSACGGGDDTTGSGSTGTAQLTAAVVPAMPAAAVYVGLEQKLFAAERIDLKTQPAQTGAAVVASVLNGEVQVGYMSTVVAIRAMAEGAPIRFAAAGDMVPTDVDQKMYGGLVFADGNAVDDYRQLEGRTVAVNALQGIDNLALVAAIDAAGGDSAKVKVVEVPYPEQWSAVKSGRVDAAVMSDPFYSDAIAQGGQTYGNILNAIGPGAMISCYVVADQYAQKQSGIIKRFATAMSKSSAASNADAEAVRAVIPEFSQIPAEKAKTVTLPTFADELTADSLQAVADLMLKYGYIKKGVDASALLAQ